MLLPMCEPLQEPGATTDTLMAAYMQGWKDFASKPLPQHSGPGSSEEIMAHALETYNHYAAYRLNMISSLKQQVSHDMYPKGGESAGQTARRRRDLVERQASQLIRPMGGVRQAEQLSRAIVQAFDNALEQALGVNLYHD